MKVKIIVENTAFQTKVIAEHGLSMLIENDCGEKLLFDTGQTDSIIKNFSIYEQKISDINAIVLSHGHYDHTGGLPYILENNKSALIYAKEECFADKRRLDNSYIGIPNLNEDEKKRFVFLYEKSEIIKNVFAIPNIKIFDRSQTHFRNMKVCQGGSLVEDTFEDELFLVIDYEDKISILCGCAHRGIVNIIKSAKIHFDKPISLILGGLHTIKESDENVIKLCEELNEFDIDKICVCHCTGLDKYAVLKSNCKSEVIYASSGNVITL